MKHQTIAQLFATAMAAHGLTDTEAARRVGVSQPTASRWRSGKSIPSELHVPALAAFCQVPASTVRKLIGASEKRQPAQADGTLGHLLRTLEHERNIEAAEAFRGYGVEKSAYYRWRADRGTPHLTDVPDLAVRIGISEERLVMAIYRTTVASSR